MKILTMVTFYTKLQIINTDDKIRIHIRFEIVRSHIDQYYHRSVLSINKKYF